MQFVRMTFLKNQIMNTGKNIINGVEINLDQVYALISENRKLEAIKYIMDQTKISLFEAKKFVDDFSNEQQSITVEKNVLEQVIDLLHKNQKIDAVKLVKSATGMGLKESKDFVDRISNQSPAALLSTFKNKNIESSTVEIGTLNSAGQFNNHYFAGEKKIPTYNKSNQKRSLSENESSAKIKKTLILLLVGMAAIAYYFYQR